MAVACEDLAPYEVTLIPPSTAEYFELLTDIKRRLQERPKGSPPVEHETLSRISEHDTSGSAILLHQARVAIATIAYFWSFRSQRGSIVPHSFSPGTNPSVLLPFNLNERNKKFHAFWNTIFPGSKRLMMANGSMFGDNTDVRPPTPDELWHGGFIFGRSSRSEQLEPLKLTLDGVFFADGGFAGPNRLGSWERTVFAAEAYLTCAALARKARQSATSPADFFTQVKQFTGLADEARNPFIKHRLDAIEAYKPSAQGGSEVPPPPLLPPPPPPPSPLNAGPPDPEPIRKREQQAVGWQVLQMRQTLGEEAAIATIESWADVPAPHFHKL